MPARRPALRLLRLLFAVASLGLVAGRAAGQEAAALRDKARSVHDRGGYQPFPESSPGGKFSPGRRTSPARPGRPAEPGREFEPELPRPPAALSGIAWVFLAVVAVVLLALVVVGLANGFGSPAAVAPPPSERSGTEAGTATAPDAPGPRPPDHSLAQAETLAAADRHGEALHALLLATILGLQSRRSLAPPPSLTSRELLRVFPLDREPAARLSRLVRAVELVLFGGRRAGPADWERGLEDYRAVLATGPAGSPR